MQKSEIQVGKEYALREGKGADARSKYAQRGQRTVMITDISSEDSPVQKTFAEHLEKVLE